jgi:UDP-glucose 4-epimerase
VDLIKGDIADPATFDGIFERYSNEGGIYAVIHVAVSLVFAWYLPETGQLMLTLLFLQALKAVGESGEIPLLYYQTNVSATINLMQVRSRYTSFPNITQH